MIRVPDLADQLVLHVDVFAALALVDQLLDHEELVGRFLVVQLILVLAVVLQFLGTVLVQLVLEVFELIVEVLVSFVVFLELFAQLLPLLLFILSLLIQFVFEELFCVLFLGFEEVCVDLVLLLFLPHRLLLLMVLHNDLAHHVELTPLRQLIVPFLGLLYFQKGLLPRFTEPLLQVKGLILICLLQLFLEVHQQLRHPIDMVLALLIMFLEPIHSKLIDTLSSMQIRLTLGAHDASHGRLLALVLQFHIQIDSVLAARTFDWRHVVEAGVRRRLPLGSGLPLQQLGQPFLALELQFAVQVLLPGLALRVLLPRFLEKVATLRLLHSRPFGHRCLLLLGLAHELLDPGLMLGVERCLSLLSGLISLS